MAKKNKKKRQQHMTASHTSPTPAPATTTTPVSQVLPYRTMVDSPICEFAVIVNPKNTSNPVSVEHFTYKAKPFSPEEWWKMVAFMKWGMDRYNSEVQVRLYYHPEHGWRAKAKPQKANTGMTAQELPDVADPTPTPDGDYFGTNHSHVKAAAFQSGTDHANEINQDGLHITLGKLDQKVIDIHVRFYMKGFAFNIPYSKLWDVSAKEQEIDSLPPFVARYVDRATMVEAAAREAMCTVPDDLPEAPKDWTDNVIATTQATQSAVGSYHGGWQGSDWTPGGFNGSGYAYVPAAQSFDEALKSLFLRLKVHERIPNNSNTPALVEAFRNPQTMHSLTFALRQCDVISVLTTLYVVTILEGRHPTRLIADYLAHTASTKGITPGGVADVIEESTELACKAHQQKMLDADLGAQGVALDADDVLDAEEQALINHQLAMLE